MSAVIASYIYSCNSGNIETLHCGTECKFRTASEANCTQKKVIGPRTDNTSPLVLQFLRMFKASMKGEKIKNVERLIKKSVLNSKVEV